MLVNKVICLFSFITSILGLSIIPGLESYFDKAIDVFELSKDQEFELPDVKNIVPNPNERPVPGDSPIVECDALESQILDLQSVVLTPNPPEKGQNLTVTAKGYLSEDVEDGAYVEVEVRYGFIKLIHQTFDLCEEISKVDLECPIKKGEQIITKEVEIPDEVPPGRYMVNARAYTKDDEFITCLAATVDFA